MNTNPQLTVSDLYTGKLPVFLKVKNRHGYSTYFLNFGEVYTFCPKLYIPGKPSTLTIQLMQIVNRYERLDRFAAGNTSKRAKTEFKKALKAFKISLHHTSQNGEWYVLD